MLITIKNFGPIRKAQIDTSEMFTVFCGPNSTGKTYVSYLLYAIFSTKEIFDLPFYKQLVDDIKQHGAFCISIEQANAYLARLSEHIASNFGVIFGISDADVLQLYKNFSLKLEIDEQEMDEIAGALNISLTCESRSRSVTAVKMPGEHSVSVECDAIQESDAAASLDQILLSLVGAVVRNWALGGVNSARMLTVERNSIYTFKTELSLSRNLLIDRILELNKGNEDIERIIGNNARRYPMAVRDSLRIANDLVNVQKRKGEFYDVANEIENQLLGGQIGANKDGDVQFTPADSKHALPVQISSSIVKTLSSLIIYLKHLAGKGDLLIIDEPEMNMHPANQILIARILVLLVNRGLRLLVSTHSDYIVREINNMTMAYQLGSHASDAIANEYDEDCKLNPADQKVYMFDYKRIRTSNRVDTYPIEENCYGFSVSTIDSTINHQNEMTEDLYDDLSQLDQQ